MYRKKINKIVLGTNNQGKVREIWKLLPKRVQIDTPKRQNIKSPKETGSTFLENSLIKAKYSASLLVLSNKGSEKLDNSLSSNTQYHPARRTP